MKSRTDQVKMLLLLRMLLNSFLKIKVLKFKKNEKFKKSKSNKKLRKNSKSKSKN